MELYYSSSNRYSRGKSDMIHGYDNVLLLCCFLLVLVVEEDLTAGWWY